MKTLIDDEASATSVVDADGDTKIEMEDVKENANCLSGDEITHAIALGFVDGLFD